MKLLKPLKCECPDVPIAKMKKTLYYQLATSLGMSKQALRGNLVGHITMFPKDLTLFNKKDKAAKPVTKQPKKASKKPKPKAK